MEKANRTTASYLRLILEQLCANSQMINEHVLDKVTSNLEICKVNGFCSGNIKLVMGFVIYFNRLFHIT